MFDFARPLLVAAVGAVCTMSASAEARAAGSQPPADIAASAAASACADAHVVPGAGSLARLAKATLCLLNRERARRHLRPLRRNRSLDGVASRYARQMVEARFFNHVSPRGATLTQRVRATSYLDGLRSWSIGENLAWGTGSYATAAQTVRSWMDSPGHRRNILDRRFREIGIGVASGVPVRIAGASPGATYAHVFGRRVRR